MRISTILTALVALSVNAAVCEGKQKSKYFEDVKKIRSFLDDYFDENCRTNKHKRQRWTRCSNADRTEFVLFKVQGLLRTNVFPKSIQVCTAVPGGTSQECGETINFRKGENPIDFVQDALSAVGPQSLRPTPSPADNVVTALDNYFGKNNCNEKQISNGLEIKVECQKNKESATFVTSTTNPKNQGDFQKIVTELSLEFGSKNCQQTLLSDGKETKVECSDNDQDVVFISIGVGQEPTPNYLYVCDTSANTANCHRRFYNIRNNPTTWTRQVLKPNQKSDSDEPFKDVRRALKTVYNNCVTTTNSRYYQTKVECTKSGQTATFVSTGTAIPAPNYLKVCTKRQNGIGQSCNISYFGNGEDLARFVNDAVE